MDFLSKTIFDNYKNFSNTLIFLTHLLCGVSRNGFTKLPLSLIKTGCEVKVTADELQPSVRIGSLAMGGRGPPKATHNEKAIPETSPTKVP